MDKSEWYKGLLLAELLGAKEAYRLLNTNEFADSSGEFVNGIIDYIEHWKRLDLLTKTVQNDCVN